MSSDSVVEGWKKSGDKQRANPDDVITKFREVHGMYYDYSNMKYTRNRDKVEIICPIHGSFMQTPRTHKKGGNCPKCAIKLMAKSKEFDLGKVILGFIAVHGDKYDYSNVIYKGSHVKVAIKCFKHGVFQQTPAVHKKGSGCPKCGTYGFNTLAPAILYYVRVDYNGDVFYKVGITNRSVVERFGPDMKYVTVLHTWEYQLGADAYNAEQTILNLNEEYRYKGDNILVSGNTELFTVDIGGFDNV